MDLKAFHALMGPCGQEALASAQALEVSDATMLRALVQLRRRFDEPLASAALATVQLRERAVRKFTRAGSMYFTSEALQQASGEPVARHRARRFSQFGSVLDLCCGIGGDALALGAVARVNAIDLDPLRVAMARENARAYGVEARCEFVAGDLLEVPLPSAEAAFFDPSRRVEGRRTMAVCDYMPPVGAVLDRLPAGLGVGMKIAPGVSWDEIREYEAEVEFISQDGELKECVLWFGPLRAASRRATLLPGGHELVASDAPVPLPQPAPPGAWLYDPDPAVLRSGLLGVLAGQLSAWPIDADVGYLSSKSAVATPFASLLQVEAAIPFHLKELRAWLRDRGVGRVEVRKRGSALDANEFARQLRLKGTEFRIVLLTRVLGRPYSIVACRPG